MGGVRGEGRAEGGERRRRWDQWNAGVQVPRIAQWNAPWPKSFNYHFHKTLMAEAEEWKTNKTSKKGDGAGGGRRSTGRGKERDTHSVEINADLL